ncbi:hypothetical protein SAMN05421768_105177 [Chryseobacterium joostei]|uniref:Uncharacterized protein n=1 Tax=Chryseobacterium joostei TaxID=112234 RepID=A0A1N7IGU1_9FLAO|nr:hypothetical protein SAMN05421768_105177 [Chryseobacterium joostei]
MYVFLCMIDYSMMYILKNESNALLKIIAHYIFYDTQNATFAMINFLGVFKKHFY